MIDDKRIRAASAFVMALAMGVLGALGVGVALWYAFGWTAAVAFWGVLAMVAAWVIMQSEA
jgi:Zn-dependent protease